LAPAAAPKSRNSRYAEERLDVVHDPCVAADRDPLADLEWLLAAQVTRRDHLVAAPKLVSVVRHRRVPRPQPPRCARARISLSS
jgi:hypothetical protein